MLRVALGFDEVKIRFDHKICGSTEIHNFTGICVEENRRCSIVTVILNEKEVGHGMAVCNPVDNFCRATGRKRAMTIALSSLTKELRTAVWEEYWATCSL